MAKRSDATKRKAKKNLKKAKVLISKFRARAKVELTRHGRALRVAAKRYKGALKQS
jgi:hypothetical protein